MAKKTRDTSKSKDTVKSPLRDDLALFAGGISFDHEAKSRNTEIHRVIGVVIRDLKLLSDQFPSAETVWKRLSERQEEFDCIQGIELSNKTKERAIFWRGAKGGDRETGYGSFKNIVSKFKTGNKPLPK